MNAPSSFKSVDEDGYSYHNMSRYYFWTTDLGAVQPTTNPMKGLIGSPRFDNTPATTIPASMEFYYIQFNEVVIGENEYDWTSLERILDLAASRSMHVVLTSVIHYPGEPLYLPDYLLKNVGVKNYTSRFGYEDTTPLYDDPNLLSAIRNYILALGARYDGDTRIFSIHTGLLGFWGEWHTHCAGDDLISEEVKIDVLSTYAKAFHTTNVQTRYPHETAYTSGIGLIDMSFAYHTLSDEHLWYYWPSVVEVGHGDVWRFAVMGGETRPEIQHLTFTDVPIQNITARQDFMDCVRTTHTTYMIHHDAFTGTGYSGTVLENAMKAHTEMGYNFYVKRVAVEEGTDDTVLNVYATIEQSGVAPFYYPLSLKLECADISLIVEGVEGVIGTGEYMTFRFNDIPASKDCLNNMSLLLYSPYMYDDRPIKFAQGDNGIVSFRLPLPGEEPRPETNPPTLAPTMFPTSSPTKAPTPMPTSPSSKLKNIGRWAGVAAGAMLVVLCLLFSWRRVRRRYQVTLAEEKELPESHRTA